MEHVVRGPKLDSVDYAKWIKKQKVNIGMEEKLELVIIGEYWDDKITQKMVNLLHKYHDWFPITFS